MMDALLKYDLGNGVEAFSTERDAALPYPVVQPHQTHGVEVAIVTDPLTAREQLEGIDALVTDVKGCAIGVRTADCIPVLMYDNSKGVVAAVHSGWRGTVSRIVSNAITVMSNEFGTDPADIHAAIGPGIGPDSFQVGEDVAMAFKDAGFDMERIWRFMGPRAEDGSMKGGHHIDLYEAVRITLIDSGVPERNIQVAGIDTFVNSSFYSARREGVTCGRIINSIMLI